MGTELATAKADAGFALFFAQELHLFFQHLHHAAETFNITKELPQSIFKAYNDFVKNAMEDLKLKGLANGKELFALAVAEWSKLSDAQKAKVTEDFKAKGSAEPGSSSGCFLGLNAGRAPAHLHPPTRTYPSPHLLAASNPEAGAVMEGRLADVPGEGRPQDLVVRVDAGGASVLSSTRILPVVRHVATTLNQHFPGRLYVMELHNLPPFATWLVVAVRGLMHATTRDKVVVVGEGGRHAAPPP
ncbi:hypothetical protein F751_5535 [Auxenochlorella protothecoides]|uniref:CRAL-TRIO domain-containing protein n=1 Tax=Auxenochlorella protothecoides TaxID=3075 RepID=A0A087SAS2_AUXPR|nr:hypothetical protein F751_5535 [Auxenochlorella protothecoides]KFM22826.1 hypothetical protein F751_5535 [Auxenochlorella protothecoides]